MEKCGSCKLRPKHVFVAGHNLCELCFATGIARPVNPKQRFYANGLEVDFKPKGSVELRILMAPRRAEVLESEIRVVAHLTSEETALAAEHIAEDYYMRTGRNFGSLFLEAGYGWLRIDASIPSDLVAPEFHLSSKRDWDLIVCAFLPYKRRSGEPHAGEAERLGGLLARASKARLWDPDKALRQRLDENLREKFT